MEVCKYWNNYLMNEMNDEWMMMMVDEMHKRYAIDNQWLQNRSQ